MEDNCSSKKRKLRESNIEALDKVVFQWFWSKRSQNNPIDINLIKEKAITYAKDLGYNNFYDCPGWLERWKKEGQSFKIMFIWVNVHETCILSPSPKLTGFSFIKTFHEPYSSVLKKQNTAFANFPYFSSGRCPTISFSFFTQTTNLSTSLLVLFQLIKFHQFLVSKCFLISFHKRINIKFCHNYNWYFFILSQLYQIHLC